MKHRALASGFTQLIVRSRWAVVLFALTAAMIAASGALFLEFNSDPRAYFSKTSAERLALERYERAHGRKSTAVLMLVPGAACSAVT